VLPAIEAASKKFSHDLVLFGSFNVEENDVQFIKKNTQEINKVPLLYVYALK